MTGSWAGAMGHTQFIPTTYEALCGRFRRRRPPRHLEFAGRRARLGRELSARGGLGFRHDLGLRGRPAARLQLSARRGSEVAHSRRLGKARGAARARRGLSAAGRQGRADRAGGCERPGLPDAQEPLRHQALQQLDRLCAGGRPPGRPAARRRRIRAVLAGRRAAADRRRDRPSCSSTWHARAIMTARSTASSDRHRAPRSAHSRAGAGLPPTALPACSSCRPCGAAETCREGRMRRLPGYIRHPPRSGARGGGRFRRTPLRSPAGTSSSRRTIPGQAGSSAASLAAIAATAAATAAARALQAVSRLRCSRSRSGAKPRSAAEGAHRRAAAARAAAGREGGRRQARPRDRRLHGRTRWRRDWPTPIAQNRQHRRGRREQRLVRPGARRLLQLAGARCRSSSRNRSPTRSW